MAYQPGNNCPNCNNPVRPEARFCPRCGYTLPEATACHYCGAAYRPGAKFCPSCGRAVGAPNPTPPSSWKETPGAAQRPYPPPAAPSVQPNPVYSSPAWAPVANPVSAPEERAPRHPINRLLIAAVVGLILVIILAIIIALTVVDKPVPPPATPNVAATLTAAAESLSP